MDLRRLPLEPIFVAALLTHAALSPVCSAQAPDAAAPSPSPSRTGAQEPSIPPPPPEICFGEGCSEDEPAEEAAEMPAGDPEPLKSSEPVRFPQPTRLKPKASPRPTSSPAPLAPLGDFELSDLSGKSIQVFCRWTSPLDCLAGDSCAGEAACERWSAESGVISKARVRIRCEGTAKQLFHPQVCLRKKYPSLKIPAGDLVRD